MSRSRRWFVVIAIAAISAITTAACKRDTQSEQPASGSQVAAAEPKPPPPSPVHDSMMPQKTAPRTPEKQANGRTTIGPFTAMVPAEWTIKPVTSNMRVADYLLGDDGELVIYYFGEAGAGSINSNLERWFGQFIQPDGKASKDVAKIDKTKFAGQEATFVSVAGRFKAESMPGMGSGAPVDKPDQALLAAIVASPSGPYYFKLVGGKKTIDANTAKFRAMLTSLELH